MTPRIAVIGGGWSGLAAAATLAEAGVPCTLFEAARQLGGRARRVEAGGEALDNGQHILLGAYAETLRLLRLVHGTGTLRRQFFRQPLTIARPGGVRLRAPHLPAPLHLFAMLALARGLTVGERWRTLRFFYGLRREKFRVLPGLTVAQLVSRQPPTLVEQVWEPLCVAALNTPMAQASAQIFLNVLEKALAGPREASDLLLPRTDLHALFPQPARIYLEHRGSEVRLGEVVTSLRAKDSRFQLALRDREESFDAVVCAVAPQHFARLTADVPMLLPLRNAIGRFAYHPIATLYLDCEPAPRTNWAMTELDGKPGQWLFDRGRLGGKSGCFAVVISAATLARGVEQERLIRDVLAQLRRSWPDWPKAQWSKVIMEKRATFACTPNLVRPEAGRVMQGFYLAGDYTDAELPATLEAAVRSGVRAARALLADRSG